MSRGLIDRNFALDRSAMHRKSFYSGHTAAQLNLLGAESGVHHLFNISLGEVVAWRSLASRYLTCTIDRTCRYLYEGAGSTRALCATGTVCHEWLSCLLTSNLGLAQAGVYGMR